MVVKKTTKKKVAKSETKRIKVQKAVKAKFTIQKGLVNSPSDKFLCKSCNTGFDAKDLDKKKPFLCPVCGSASVEAIIIEE